MKTTRVVTLTDPADAIDVMARAATRAVTRLNKKSRRPIVNGDLAGYHIASHADAQHIDAAWIDEHDPHYNPMGAKGAGEIGIVGVAAAIANAVYHATGIRIRELPITPGKLVV